MFVAPVYVFVPVSVSVPEPALARLPLLAITPA